MKKISIIFVTLILVLKSAAQQDPMYTQYWINASILNPAQTAADGITSLNLTGRYQWVNVNGAPKTGSLSFVTMPVNRLGIGASYVYDEIGPVKSSTVNADVAYHLNVSKNWIVTLGTRLSVNNTNMNLRDLSTDQSGDPMFSQNMNTGMKPNIGFGFLVHNDRFYFGFSQPRSIEYDLSSSTYMNSKILPHRFAYMGYNISLNDEIDLRPSVLCREVNYAPVQFDANLVAEFKQKISVGASYRTGDGIGVLAGISATEHLKIYYCYDYPLTVISLVSKQTHQISLTYNFNKLPRRINSPRYFD
ncbi:MAG: type IX secretion system membrane protein PorP/SprF [Bacteroidota bacterium]